MTSSHSFGIRPWWLAFFGLIGLFAFSYRADAARNNGAETRFRYDGSFVFYTERAEGTSICDVRQPAWSTNGSLRLSPNAANDELRVREEATGCTLVARKVDGVFVADGQACTFDPRVGLSWFGIGSKTFDEFRYDPAAQRLRAKGLMKRKTADGTIVVSCFEMDVSLRKLFSP